MWNHPKRTRKERKRLNWYVSDWLCSSILYCELHYQLSSSLSLVLGQLWRESFFYVYAQDSEITMMDWIGCLALVRQSKPQLTVSLDTGVYLGTSEIRAFTWLSHTYTCMLTFLHHYIQQVSTSLSHREVTLPAKVSDHPPVFIFLNIMIFPTLHIFSLVRSSPSFWSCFLFWNHFFLGSLLWRDFSFPNPQNPWFFWPK